MVEAATRPCHVIASRPARARAAPLGPCKGPAAQRSDQVAKVHDLFGGLRVRARAASVGGLALAHESHRDVIEVPRTGVQATDES